MERDIHNACIPEEKFRTALLNVLFFEENRVLIERFRFAFEYRRDSGYVSILEAGMHLERYSFPQLYGGLKSALCCIYQLESCIQPVAPERKSLDKDFLRGLRITAGELAKDRNHIKHLSFFFEYDGIDSENMSVESLEEQIKTALDKYSRSRNNGLSDDPW